MLLKNKPNVIEVTFSEEMSCITIGLCSLRSLVILLSNRTMPKYLKIFIVPTCTLSNSTYGGLSVYKIHLLNTYDKITVGELRFGMNGPSRPE